MGLDPTTPRLHVLLYICHWLMYIIHMMCVDMYLGVCMRFIYGMVCFDMPDLYTCMYTYRHIYRETTRENQPPHRGWVVLCPLSKYDVIFLLCQHQQDWLTELDVFPIIWHYCLKRIHWATKFNRNMCRYRKTYFDFHHLIVPPLILDTLTTAIRKQLLPTWSECFKDKNE